MGIVLIVLATFAILGVIAWASISSMERQSTEAEECHTFEEHLDHLEDELSRTGNRLENLEDRVMPAIHLGKELREQVDHLARVQLLILKELKKEHQVQPQKDVLVTIEPLSKMKERGQ